MTTLEVNGLTKSYGAKQAVKPQAFSLEAGRVVGLAGDNGAGKTTLLRMIADVAKPSSGTAAVAGVPVGAKSHGLVAFMPDASNLYTWMRTGMLIKWHDDMFADFSSEAAYHLCGRMELDPNERVKTLSKGYAERVMLMLILARRVPLYILDEPLGGADPGAKRLLKTVIRECLREDCTFFISSHLLNDMEDLFDEVMFMKHGEIIQRALLADIHAATGKSIDEYYAEVMQPGSM